MASKSYPCTRQKNVNEPAQLYFKLKQSTDTGDNSVEKRHPTPPKWGGCEPFSDLPKI